MTWDKISLDGADLVFSKWIRLRDRRCLRCGSAVRFNPKGLPVSHQNSHFQGRGKEATRFDPDNCCTLDGGCHSYFTANPAEHYLWQVERLGQKTVDSIVLASNMYHKKDRRAELLYWKQRLKEDYGLVL